MLSPICLFLYNRPEHSCKTLDKLQEAEGAKESQLFIFCDGPKEGTTFEEIERIKEVRKIAEEVKVFQKITIIKQTSNLGLATSIIQGVTKVIEEFGRVIVLEDDHLVHRDFLKYMNFYLDKFEKEERVMHITGFLRDSYFQFVLPQVFLTRFMECGSWATWSNRWKKLITDFKIIDQTLCEIDFLERFNFQKLEHHTYFEPNRNGLKTWAIFWYFTIAYYNGLCIMPKYSYVKNIGNDGSGSNNVVQVNELSSNFARRFNPFHPKIKESRFGELYIQDAYAKRSKKRFTTPKKIALKLFSYLRNLTLSAKSI
jgi:GT2 family glycosyltransferase